MLSDLFKILAINESPSDLQLDNIGFEQTSESLVRKSPGFKEDSGSVEPEHSDDSPSELTKQSDVENWSFPVFMVTGRWRVEKPVLETDPLDGIPQWKPISVPHYTDTNTPAPLLDTNQFQLMIEQNILQQSTSNRVDIRLLVDKIACYKNYDPLPRQTRNLPAGDYCVICDFLRELNSDLAALRSLFLQLPLSIQPRQIWSLDQFGEWQNSQTRELRKFLPKLPVGQIVLVTDSRSPGNKLIQDLQLTAKRYGKIHHLCVTPRTSMYWGRVRPALSETNALARLLQLLYSVHRFPRALLREMRVQLDSSTAAELDFWRHPDVQCHNSALFDTGSVANSRISHYQQLESWLENNDGTAQKLINQVLCSLKVNTNQYFEAIVNLPNSAVEKSLVDAADRHFASMAVVIEGTTKQSEKYELSAVLLGVSERLVGSPSGMLARAIEVAQRYRRKVDVDISIVTGTPQEWMEGAVETAVLVHTDDGQQLKSDAQYPGEVARFEVKAQNVIVENNQERQWLTFGETISAREYALYSANETIHCQSRNSNYFHWAESLDQNAEELTLTTQQGLKLAFSSVQGIAPENQPLLDTSNAPAWLASAVTGIDEYGLYAMINIYNIDQKMRWIPPGHFMMGSPPDEPGRYDREALHEVVLTDGYWLAETCCTQALWQAVMRDNPSHFKGDDLPVETVSWNDAQTFLKKLNIDYPDLHLCLPTEAQWEYACRAGTDTAFSMGDRIDTNNVNYFEGLEDDYDTRNKGNSVDVASLPPNQWGLYEMHGNVLEWCDDWYGEYKEGLEVNPNGRHEGDDRVLRGGCWVHNARHCRSAYRDSGVPSHRLHGIGFRFAQVDQRTAAKRKHAEGQEDAGQARRSRISRAASAVISRSGKKTDRSRR